MLESIQRSCLTVYDVYNQRYKRLYTNVLDLHFQGQVNYSRFSEILNILNVRFETKIKSSACILPEIRKVIQ